MEGFKVTILEVEDGFKIKNQHLSKYDVDQIVDFLQHEFSEGRNADAPELSLLTGQVQDHDNELHVTLPDGLGKGVGAQEKRRSFEPKSVDKPLLSGALV